MKIRYLKIQNFKQFKEIELKDIPNLVFLVGKNGSGKSSLLELLWFFWRFLPNEGDSISYGRSATELTYLRSNNNPIHITVSVEDNSNSVGIETQSSPLMTIHQTYTPGAQSLTLGLTEGYIGKQKIRENRSFKETKLESGTVLGTNELSAMWNKILSFRGSFRLLTPYRNQPSNPDQLFQRQPYLLQTFYSNTHSRHANYDDVSDWENQQHQFSAMLPDKLLDETGNEVSVASRGPGGKRVQFNSYLEGGGIQELMQVDDFLMQPGGIYVIDEPELHLHADLEKRLLGRISELAKDKQIFLSTHSPFMLDTKGEGAIYVFSASNLTASVSRVAKSEYWSVLHGLGIKPHDFLLFDAVLFVEGDTELEVIPIWADKLGLDLSAVNVLPMIGVTNTGYNVRPWVSATGRIPFEKIFVLVDNNGKQQIESVTKEKLITKQQTLVLEKQDIEDFYPLPLVKEAYNQLFALDIDLDKIPNEVKKKGGVVSYLLGYFKAAEKEPPDEWKVRLGRWVAKKMDANDIPNEVGAFLKNISLR